MGIGEMAVRLVRSNFMSNSCGFRPLEAGANCSFHFFIALCQCVAMIFFPLI